MATPRQIHTAQVEEWLSRNAVGLSSSQLIELFDRVLTVLWRRTNLTISNVTLAAVMDRVLHITSEGFPLISLLKLSPSGILFEELRKRAKFLKAAEVVDALRAVLIETLFILGSVTADVISPELQSELFEVSRKEPTVSAFDNQTPRIKTGVRNLDEILHGGIPKGSLLVMAGNPGSGKTILSQQIAFQNASPENPVVFFQTLSESTAKTLSYVKRFSFFDQKKVGHSIHFIDLGDMVGAEGLQHGFDMILETLRRIRPSLVIIDSFKTFDDLAESSKGYRNFCYEIAIHLMAWECTSLLLGEFGPLDIETSPLFSVVDGLIVLSQRQESGEQQRFAQVIKVRGTAHNLDEHSLAITDHGVEVYAPRVTIQRDPRADTSSTGEHRYQTGIQTLDQLIEDGIPGGSSVLLSGVSGTGKTLLALEFLYRGASQFNEKGIIFLFEESEERIRSTARKMGWNLDAELERGWIEIVTIPQQDILVERDLQLIHERVKKLGAKRVVIDSVSVFLYKIANPTLVRDKIYQLATIIQNMNAVGFFPTDVSYGSGKLSRFGVEETVVDGIILLTSTEEGLERNRYLEIYKIRNTTHASGRSKMKIATGGIHLDRPELKISKKGAHAAA